MKRVLPAAASAVLVFALALFVGVANVDARSVDPGAQGLVATSGPGEGQVTLKWQQNDSTTTGYDVLYGQAPRVYEYALGGLTNPGLFGWREVTIGSLVPGRTYYFVVKPRGGSMRGLSNEVSAAGFSVSKPEESKWAVRVTGAKMASAVPGSASGTIDLSWKQDAVNVERYDIFYGTEAGKYVHALSNISSPGLGGTRTVTIGALNPGGTYYFLINPRGSQLSQTPVVSAKAAK